MKLVIGALACVLVASLGQIAESQAVAEYGLGAGRAATTTAPARKLGTSLTDLFGNATKAAQGDPASGEPAPPAPEKAAPKPNRSARPKRSTTAVANKAAVSEPAPATQEATEPPPVASVPVCEDPRKIQAGIGYDELVRRFGPPSMSITTGPGRSMLLYSCKETSYQIEVEDGKVIAPRGTPSQ